MAEYFDAFNNEPGHHKPNAVQSHALAVASAPIAKPIPKPIPKVQQLDVISRMISYPDDAESPYKSDELIYAINNAAEMYNGYGYAFTCNIGEFYVKYDGPRGDIVYGNQIIQDGPNTYIVYSDLNIVIRNFIVFDDILKHQYEIQCVYDID